MPELHEPDLPMEKLPDEVIDALAERLQYSTKTQIETSVPVWVRWPLWAQMVIWIGPPILMALYFMAQDSGYLRSPIITNGDKIEQVEKEVGDLKYDLGNNDKINAEILAHVIEEQTLLTARGPKFDVLENNDKQSIQLLYENRWVTQKLCLSLLHDKTQCVPPIVRQGEVMPEKYNSGAIAEHAQ